MEEEEKNARLAHRIARKTFLVGTDSQSGQLTCDCRIQKKALDMSWVICKSLVNDLYIKYDNYLHMFIQEMEQCKKKQLQKN